MPPKRRYGGTVGIAAFDTGRFSEFSISLAGLEKPPGWEITSAFNYDLAHARNFLASNFVGDHLWLMDDDMVFQSDVLRRLLAHELDIVGPLYLGRRSPFPPYAKKDGNWITLPQQPGLVEVDEAGGAGLLIHRRVFDALERPWFDHGTEPDGSHVNDDAFFCRKARESGFKIFVDTAVQLSHIALVKISPSFDGHWQRRLAIGDAVISIDS